MSFHAVAKEVVFVFVFMRYLVAMMVVAAVFVFMRYLVASIF